MSDDEEVVYVKKSKIVHYGSLEEQERARLAALSTAGDENDTSNSPKGADEQGDIHISNEYMELEDEISKDKQALLEEFERRRKARQLNVSTDDDEVRRSLRQLAEPVCVFGEGPAERRVRLRDLLSSLGEDAIHKKMVEEEAAEEQRRGQEGTWYHEGPPQLREARLWIARYSLPRAKERLKLAREAPSGSRVAVRQEMQRRLASATISRSQVGDTRPLSYCNFSGDSQMLATGSWSGLCKVWSVPDCIPMQTLNGHSCNVGCIVFRPGASLPDHYKDRIAAEAERAENRMDQDLAVVERPGGECVMASCCADGKILLWSFESSAPQATLDTRFSDDMSVQRVSRLAWHPAGRHLAAAVHDASWRLWDVEKRIELLHQEGHSKAVHCVAFHVDGSLVASGGMDSFGRIWDVRTGRCVMFLEGHLQPVLAVDWSPRGNHIATASADNTAKVWDVRKRSKLYTIPAHTNLLSGIRYHPSGGHFLVTSSYDNSARVWSNPTWQPLKTLLGHDNKVMGVDVAPDGKYIATCSYDRTFKLWAPEIM